MPKNFDEPIDLLEEGDVPSNIDAIIRALQDVEDINLGLGEELDFEGK